MDALVEDLTKGAAQRVFEAAVRGEHSFSELIRRFTRVRVSGVPTIKAIANPNSAGVSLRRTERRRAQAPRAIDALPR